MNLASLKLPITIVLSLILSVIGATFTVTSILKDYERRISSLEVTVQKLQTDLMANVQKLQTDLVANSTKQTDDLSDIKKRLMADPEVRAGVRTPFADNGIRCDPGFALNYLAVSQVTFYAEKWSCIAVRPDLR